jgi:hypothetical protein
MILPELTYGRSVHYVRTMEKSPIISPVRALIDRWASRADFAQDVGAPLASVHKWSRNGRIPSRWQASVILAAQSKGFADITARWMVNVHAEAGIAA